MFCMFIYIIFHFSAWYLLIGTGALTARVNRMNDTIYRNFVI